MDDSGWSIIKPQVEHDASYMAALARATICPPGAAAIDPMGVLGYHYRVFDARPPLEPIVADPYGSQRRAQHAKPRAALKPKAVKPKSQRVTVQTKVLEWLDAQDGPRSIKQVMDALECSHESAAKTLGRLKTLGLAQYRLARIPGSSFRGEWIAVGREWTE